MLLMRASTAALVTLAIGLLIGCSGGGNSYVTGTVKFTDGQPVTTGYVQFDSDSISASGPIQPDGTYQMGSLGIDDGVPPGIYRVSLGGGAISGASEGEPIGPPVDEKFGNPSTSGLTCEVKAGESVVFDIVVEQAKAR